MADLSRMAAEIAQPTATPAELSAIFLQLVRVLRVRSSVQSRNFLANRAATQVVLRECSIFSSSSTTTSSSEDLQSIALDVLTHLTSDRGPSAGLLVREHPSLVPALLDSLGSETIYRLSFDVQRKQLHVIGHLVVLQPVLFPPLVAYILNVLKPEEDVEEGGGDQQQQQPMSQAQVDLRAKALSVCDDMCADANLVRELMQQHQQFLPTVMAVVLSGVRSRHTVCKQTISAISVLARISAWPHYRSTLHNEFPKLIPHLAHQLFEQTGHMVQLKSGQVLSNLSGDAHLYALVKETMASTRDLYPQDMYVNAEARKLMTALATSRPHQQQQHGGGQSILTEHQFGGDWRAGGSYQAAVRRSPPPRPPRSPPPRPPPSHHHHHHSTGYYSAVVEEEEEDGSSSYSSSVSYRAPPPPPPPPLAPPPPPQLPPPQQVVVVPEAKRPRREMPDDNLPGWLAYELRGVGGHEVVDKLASKAMLGSRAELESLAKWNALDMRSELQLNIVQALRLWELLGEVFPRV